MRTETKEAVSIEAALKLAKPYVGSLRAKHPGSRPILKCALVTGKYVIATDAHTLIRIEHNEIVSEPYLHHYKKWEESEHLTVNQYPQTERLIPQVGYEKDSGPVDVKEMYEAVTGAQVVSAQNEKVLDVYTRVQVTEDKIHVPDIVPGFQTGEYTYRLDRLIPVTEETHFDGKYLVQVFKTFKQYRTALVDMYYYGPMRPIYLVGGPVEIILLPCRRG